VRASEGSELPTRVARIKRRGSGIEREKRLSFVSWPLNDRF